MKNLRKLNNYWTKLKCIEMSKTCETRSEFNKKYKRAYHICLKNNWSEAFEHMKIFGNLYKRCVYKMIFHRKDKIDEKYIYIGLTFNYQLRINQHLKCTNDQVYKYINKNDLIFEKSYMFTDYIDVENAQKNEINEIKIHKNENKFIVINEKSGGTLGGNFTTYTYEKCKEYISYCKTPSEFREKYKTAYRTCLKHKWYDILDNLKKHKKHN